MKKLMALIAAMVFFAGTAYAAEWNFYGSSRVFTQYTDYDEVPPTVDNEDFDMGLQSNSRIGANVKVSDELTGRFEYGTGVNLRLLYGEWNFGPGSFLVGQSYTPLNVLYSNQVYNGDIDMLGTGAVYSGREAMLQLKFGGFKIAAVQEAVTGLAVATVETDLPAIEASYSANFDPVSLQVAGGYNTYKLLSGGSWYDVDSWVIAVGAKANLGMFYVAGDIYFGENADKLIYTDYADANGTEPAASVSGGTVLDVENYGFLILAGAKINDMFAVEAGYGLASADKDLSTSDDEVSSYYLQATITLAPGVFLVPEVGVHDYEETGSQEITYGTIKWQINF